MSRRSALVIALLLPSSLLADGASRAATGASPNTLQPLAVPEFTLQLSMPRQTMPLRNCLFALHAEHAEDDAPRALAMACLGEEVASFRSLGPVPPRARGFRFVGLGAERLAIEIGARGRLHRIVLDATGALIDTRDVIDHAGLGEDGLGWNVDIDGDGTEEALASTVEGLSVWRRTEPSFTLLGSTELPRVASSDADSLAIDSAEPIEVYGEIATQRWFWTPRGDQARLGLQRVQLGPDGPSTRCQAFVDLDRPLDPDAAAVAAGPRPVLVFLGNPTERMALLGEQEFVVAPLVCRANRKPEAPLQRFETRFANYFGAPRLQLEDVTGDGTLDAVVDGFVGRISPNLELSVFPGLGDGRFQRRDLRFSRSVDSLATMRWWADVDLDGWNDLLFRDREALLVVPRRNAAPGKLPFDEKAIALGPLPTGFKPIDYLGAFRAPAGQLQLVVSASSMTKDKSAKSRTVVLILPAPAALERRQRSN